MALSSLVPRTLAATALQDLPFRRCSQGKKWPARAIPLTAGASVAAP
jgi:hypothetical protein